MKDISTLIEDVYELFNPDEHHEANEEFLEILCLNLKDILRDRLAIQKNDRPIRFSGLGKPNRQIWYETHPDEDNPPEKMQPKTYYKFLYGAVIEELLLYLAREAGHTVEATQHKVEYAGVTGSIDAIIDGKLVDVKSASPYGYKKFENNTVVQENPFGYVEQLAGYSNALNLSDEAYWWAAEKVSGDLCLSPLPQSVIKHYQPEPRIDELKEIQKDDTPIPERCYSDQEDGASGNRKLSVGCSYCSHKFRCWDNLRVFSYSGAPRFLTKTVREPKVPEITTYG